MKIKRILFWLTIILAIIMTAFFCYDLMGSVQYAIIAFICLIGITTKLMLHDSKRSKEQGARYEEEYYKYHWLERILKEYYEKKKK